MALSSAWDGKRKRARNVEFLSATKHPNRWKKPFAGEEGSYIGSRGRYIVEVEVVL